MTDSELSLKIAEFLEPKPPMPEYLGPSTEHSKLGFWRMGWVPRREPNAHAWEPARDMVNDPAMTVMLMEQLREHEFSVAFYPSAIIWKLGGCDDRVTEYHGKIGLVAAEAFAKAKGLLDEALKNRGAK